MISTTMKFPGLSGSSIVPDTVTWPSLRGAPLNKSSTFVPAERARVRVAPV